MEKYRTSYNERCNKRSYEYVYKNMHGAGIRSFLSDLKPASVRA